LMVAGGGLSLRFSGFVAVRLCLLFAQVFRHEGLAL
jgi:hypothetical protein